MGLFVVVIRIGELVYHTESVYADSPEAAEAQALQRAPAKDSEGARVITVIPEPSSDPVPHV